MIQVQKTMFVVARHCAIIFCLLTSPKRKLRKVEKAMFQGLAFHFELNLTSLKCDLHELVKAMIQVLASHFELIFCLLTSPKYYLGEVEKAFFFQSRMAL